MQVFQRRGNSSGRVFQEKFHLSCEVSFSVNNVPCTRSRIVLKHGVNLVKCTAFVLEWVTAVWKMLLNWRASSFYSLHQERCAPQMYTDIHMPVSLPDHYIWIWCSRDDYFSLILLYINEINFYFSTSISQWTAWCRWIQVLTACKWLLAGSSSKQSSTYYPGRKSTPFSFD